MSYKPPLYLIIRQLRERTDTVLVGFSGGKDSVVTLDLCVKHFEHVESYFYYLIPDLAFQNDYLDSIERRYKITIHRRPHWALAQMIRASMFRAPSFAAGKCPDLGATDMEMLLREDTGIAWIVTGERAAESLHRRGMLTACRGLDDKRRRCYPISFWPVEAVRRYIKIEHLRMSPEADLIGRSFGDFSEKAMTVIRDTWPDDFAKI